ncbi:hypothetical protein MMC13_007937 [Lambiella insularis]|nr:hypothetical protein [Lambiella insularis]
MSSQRPLCYVIRVLITLLVLTGCYALALEEQDIRPMGPWNAAQIEKSLKQCTFVQELNRHRQATVPTTSNLTARLFAIIFPGSPAVNALLATLYISGPPSMNSVLVYFDHRADSQKDFLLALCPPNIDPSSLSVMVAFAVGGLLGDTLFHLLPEIFLGESSPEQARFVLVEPNKNLLLGVAIMVGFVTFVAMDKALRIATAKSGSHSHGSENPDGDAEQKAHDMLLSSAITTSSILTSSDNVKSRKAHLSSAPANSPKSDTSGSHTEGSPSIRLSAYLNLIADFTHNITDGLALSSSFYASPTLGATTTVAVFFHEIPHEVGDFALLIQSGFSKRRAMGAQFLTAVGAFLGTCLGVVVQEMGKDPSEGAGMGDVRSSGLAGTGLKWGDLLLPFTAGTFLYVGTVAVIPELLETDEDNKRELLKTLKQFIAMAFGAGIMLA